MKRFRSLIVALFLVASVISVVAFSGCKEEIFTYTNANDVCYYIKVKDPKSVSGDIVVPSQYKGLPVRPDQNAFKDCTVSRITLPEGLSYIMPNAFNNCHCPQVDIPVSVTTVDRTAFKDSEVSIYYAGNIDAFMKIDCSEGNTKYVMLPNGTKIHCVDGIYQANSEHYQGYEKCD